MAQTSQQLDDKTVESIAELTRQAIDVEITRMPGGLQYARRSGNLFEVRDVTPPLRQEALDTPQDLLLFVQKVNETPVLDSPDRPVGNINGRVQDPAIFYNEQDVAFVYSLNDVRTYARCVLVESEVWKLLQSIHNTRFNQVNFVDLLRITLRGCLVDGGELLNMCRKVRFDTAGTAEGVVNHTRQSMGKSLEQQVAGFDSFPEQVELSLPVFENFKRRVNVECALKVNPGDQTFQIIPFPLELRMAMDETLLAIRDVFAPEGKPLPSVPPIFRGKPSPVVDPFKK